MVDGAPSVVCVVSAESGVVVDPSSSVVEVLSLKLPPTIGLITIVEEDDGAEVVEVDEESAVDGGLEDVDVDEVEVREVGTSAVVRLMKRTKIQQTQRKLYNNDKGNELNVPEVFAGEVAGSPEPILLCAKPIWLLPMSNTA